VISVEKPVVDKPEIPAEYGNPTERLDWADVERRLETATVYWIASTRPDGRPHVIPRDGTWLDGGLYYGGSPQTVHHRNITHNPHIVVHIGDGQEAIIVEGKVAIEKPTEAMAQRLSDEMFAKYPQYGHVHGRRVCPAATARTRVDELHRERDALQVRVASTFDGSRRRSWLTVQHLSE
jgi:hypothetical protein